MTATVRILRGDIFASSSRTLVNPVNCVGTSGAGLAREFKRRFPLSVFAYERDVKSGDTSARLAVGRPTEYGLLENEKRVVFFATKLHWRQPSKAQWIVDGVSELSGQVCDHPAYYESIAIPALGCGLGGLQWEAVRPVIEHQAYVMKAHGVSVEIYEP